MIKTKIQIQTSNQFKVDKKTLKNLVNKMLHQINRKFNQVQLNFLNDEELLHLNKRHLNHNYFTDILTFVYKKDEPISTEIFISYERALENSKKYGVSLECELLRLIAHGLLHSIGLEDRTKAQKQKMRREENKLINLFQREIFVKNLDRER